MTPELQDWNSQIHIFSSFCKEKFSPIRPMVQKIIGDELVTDNRQTDRQTTDRQTFLSWPSSIWEIFFFFFFFFFFVYGRERTNGVKFIPPCSLRKFASLTCSACRGIKIKRLNNLNYCDNLHCLTWLTSFSRARAAATASTAVPQESADGFSMP